MCQGSEVKQINPPGQRYEYPAHHPFSVVCECGIKKKEKKRNKQRRKQTKREGKAPHPLCLAVLHTSKCSTPANAPHRQVLHGSKCPTAASAPWQQVLHTSKCSTAGAYPLQGIVVSSQGTLFPGRWDHLTLPKYHSPNGGSVVVAYKNISLPSWHPK